MTDYYPVIARGIAGLKDNTAESRQALYARVQNALLAQLRELDPPLQEPEILRQRLALERAVRKIEADASCSATNHTDRISRMRRTRANGGLSASRASSVTKMTEAPNLVPLVPGSAFEALPSPSPSRPAAMITRRPRRFIHIVALIAAWCAVLGTLALGAALYWQRDQLRAWFGSNRLARWEPMPVPSRPKVVDRIGPAQPAVVAASVQRASLYVEDADGRAGKRYDGTVIWKSEMAAEANPAGLAIRAEVEIPDRGMRMSMLLRRNTDKALPASHTMEIGFEQPGDLGEVSGIPALLMKPDELSGKSQLSGVVAKVTSGMFLVALSGVDTELDRNLQMLREQPWLDVPILYANGGRATLTVEKGSSGERAFQQAFAAWHE